MFNIPIDLASSVLLARTPTMEGASKFGKTEMTINDLARFLAVVGVLANNNGGTQY